MDKQLEAIFFQELEKYGGAGLNGYSYIIRDDAQRLYLSLSIGDAPHQHFAFTDLVVRLLGDKIIIDHDANNKPLVDALVQNGIPRQQIILAYAGEAIPENA